MVHLVLITSIKILSRTQLHITRHARKMSTVRATPQDLGMRRKIRDAHQVSSVENQIVDEHHYPPMPVYQPTLDEHQHPAILG